MNTIDTVLQMQIVYGSNVLIIGCPASGKTYLFNKLATAINGYMPGMCRHTFIQTDDFIQYGYEQSMYEVLKAIKKASESGFTLVEGVQGYRLLRKGLQTGLYYPDVVIQMHISEQQMFETYRNERSPEKMKYLKTFNKTHEKILAEYNAMHNPKKPLWINIFNLH